MSGWLLVGFVVATMLLLLIAEWIWRSHQEAKWLDPENSAVRRMREQQRNADRKVEERRREQFEKVYGVSCEDWEHPG